MAKVTGTRWQPFKRRWEGLEKKKFAHGQSHGNPLGTVQTRMGEPSKEDVRTWPESRELAGNRSNADGKSFKKGTVRTWPKSREPAGNRSNADGKAFKRGTQYTISTLPVGETLQNH